MPKSMASWWPIEGDAVKNIKIPTKARLSKLDQIFRNLGKNKNG